MSDGTTAQWRCVLTSLGVTVVEIPDLIDEACWVPTQRVGLVRAELPPPQHREVLDWLAVQAVQGI